MEFLSLSRKRSSPRETSTSGEKVRRNGCFRRPSRYTILAFTHRGLVCTPVPSLMRINVCRNEANRPSNYFRERQIGSSLNMLLTSVLLVHTVSSPSTSSHIPVWNPTRSMSHPNSTSWTWPDQRGLVKRSLWEKLK